MATLFIGFIASAGLAENTPSKHMYVANYTGGVYRYPIETSGLPAPRPDLVLTSVLKSPDGLAVDSRGDLFATDSDNPSMVYEFPFGASGNASPSREFSIGTDIAYYLDVDRNGYIYVEDLNALAIDVFAPGVSGNAKPLFQIINWPTQRTIINDVTVDSQGRLFVSVRLLGIFVYDHPLQSWKQPSRVLHEQLPSGYLAGYGPTAIDDSTSSVYSSSFPQIKQPWGRGDFAKMNIDGRTEKTDPQIFTRDCYYGGLYSAAISGPYILTSCNGAPSDVFAYRKDAFGRQRAVAAIGGVQSPTVVRLGP